MSSFIDTSNWKKSGTTLVYSYEHDGKKEGSSEKEPHTFTVQLERLSVLNRTNWQFKDEKVPESETGYSTYEYISSMGVLNDCLLHAITLDESQNEGFTRLEVSIHPIELTKLQETSTIRSLELLRGSEASEEGWLKGELGRIGYYGETEFFSESSLEATLYLESDKFKNLVRAVKAGGIRSAQLTILADVYHFGYESLGAGIPGHYYNYAILCEDRGNGVAGFTEARLEELLLEWSPSLAAQTGRWRDKPEESDILDSNLAPENQSTDLNLAHAASDVQIIRRRIDTLFQVAIVVFIVWVLSQFLHWLGS